MGKALPHFPLHGQLSRTPARADCTIGPCCHFPTRTAFPSGAAADPVHPAQHGSSQAGQGHIFCWHRGEEVIARFSPSDPSSVQRTEAAGERPGQGKERSRRQEMPTRKKKENHFPTQHHQPKLKGNWPWATEQGGVWHAPAHLCLWNSPNYQTAHHSPAPLGPTPARLGSSWQGDFPSMGRGTEMAAGVYGTSSRERGAFCS